MNNFFLEILIVFLLIIANSIFAMAEIAIISARKARLQQLADEGNRQARTALELANNPNQFLSTAQIGITLIGILAGAFGGATIAEVIAAAVKAVPLLAPYSEAIGVGIVVVTITYFSLIIGELVPKRVALNNAERIASVVAAPMRTLSLLASPLVRLLSFSTDLVIRLLGITPSAEPAVTQEEIEILIKQGTQSGVFEEIEQDMLESVLRLDERRVQSLMTVRTQIVYFDISDSVEDILHKIEDSNHSRFPVVEDNLDNVLGIVRVTDLLIQNLTHQAFDVKPLLHPPLFVPESTTALEVLDLFKKEGTHIALVTDEYGGVEGLVTHNDILETIVGYIPSMDESVEPEIVHREDGSWLLDGLLPIEKFKEVFNVDALPDEDQGHYQTLGGFVMSQIGAIPVTGQHFEWGHMRFEVVDMDGRRVDKVLMTTRESKTADSTQVTDENETST